MSGFTEVYKNRTVRHQMSIMGPIGFDHGFVITHSHERLDSIIAWCLEQFGPDGLSERWFHGGYMMWFKSATDATAFKLRWL